MFTLNCNFNFFEHFKTVFHLYPRKEKSFARELNLPVFCSGIYNPFLNTKSINITNMKVATFFSSSSSPLKSSNLVTLPSPFSLSNLTNYSNNNNSNFYSINKTFVKAIHTASMASSFNPEDARVPPALPLPTPPLTKASLIFNILYISNCTHSRSVCFSSLWLLNFRMFNAQCNLWICVWFYLISNA